MTEAKSTSDYQTEFHTKRYLNLANEVLNVNNGKTGLLEFRMKPFHECWSNFQPSSTTDESGVRLLDYGGGPCIHNLISASPKVDHIVFAEYIESNREAVKSWVAGSPEAYNWSPLVQYVVRDLEGCSTKEAISNREDELRRKIEAVISCDLNTNPIVNLDKSDVGKPFDVITTSLCVECCADSEEHYKSMVCKLCRFLKPNGYLFLFGVLHETFYTFGEATFRHFPVKQNLVEEALREAEIEDMRMEMYDLKPLKLEVTDGTAFFFASGKKSGKGAEL